MRRKDREITDTVDMLDILKRCDVLRIAMSGDGQPYVVPVSFGLDVQDGRIRLYFHGACAGMKRDMIERNARVCVEADIFHGYRQVGRDITCAYESVIGFGSARLLDGDAARHGLEAIVRHCGFEGYDAGACSAHTAVYEIALDSITGKRNLL
ncbi:MAG: pyridoxamine 5'-phosphate oxidase family protein [Candidatus Fimadaptatus sp.]